ncbi:D-glycero-beta-D-manno-heptose-7-phosphate kinase [Mycolicibacterium aichiense]|uniref:Bifunctional protein HldE n=2 Tax=Mycolicibacterium TaxID=1866885 RepID=A0AAD1HQH4_9MYCO|nr:D-glycero-beta-D-manno-heptose-7-phosphate kinase [Mycolicibacterium aichiense]MCV7016379.1 D-glycero-beta-D-manno-heptose-7-phosphate kinase [Mycolicibacterium aichiense]BBX09847.1 bifunctional protein HldE [Mycolicibacterium aichiense]STZ26485.1 Bifunctional protein hldE [Mycolicibacterium aichiense]
MESEVIEALFNKTVLVVGDLMLDRFVYGAVDRISPEAPIPVLRFREEVAMLGGAGNVACNIAALNGRAVLVGATGDDAEGSYISEVLCPASQIEARLVRSENYATTVKTRYVCEGQQILRLDREETLLDVASLERIRSTVREAIDDADALILSDYAKGSLTPDSIRAHIKAANEAGVPVIVDPKSRDYSLYRNADVITPNANEAAAATGHDCSTDEGAGHAARKILQDFRIGAVLITRGAQGMTLLAPMSGVEQPFHIRTKGSSVYDVSGAGDTVIATLSLAISAGIDIKVAAQLANSAAGIVVGKLGTAVVSADELVRAVAGTADMSFCRTREQTVAQVRQWRNEGLKVGFANGCFDLVHPGHVALLRQARDQCDRLVVALNADASVRRLKGGNRPIQDQYSRAAVIGSLRSVDLVTLFDEDTPLELIKLIRPDVLIKGDDYAIQDVIGGELVQQWGGQVYLVPLEKGHSTTNIIARSEGAVVG